MTKLVEIPHIGVVLLAGVNGAVAIAFCALQNYFAIPFEHAMMELMLIEGSQMGMILLIIIMGIVNRPP